MKTLAGLEIPVRSSHPTPPDSGAVLIYNLNGVIYHMESDGSFYQMTNAGSAGVAGDTPVFIQETQPVVSGKYLWIQTNVNGNPLDFQVWFEDGIV